MSYPNSSPPRKFPPPIAPRRLVSLAPAAGKHLIGTCCFHIFFLLFPCFNIISPSYNGGGKSKIHVYKFHFGGFRNTKTCGGMVCWIFHIFQFPLLGALRIWLQLQMVVALLSETPWPSGAPQVVRFRWRMSHGWCLMSWVFWWW